MVLRRFRKDSQQSQTVSESSAAKPSQPSTTTVQTTTTEEKVPLTTTVRKYLPTWQVIVFLIIGVIVGLIWAYMISPVEMSGTNPFRLNQTSQDQWIKMAGASFELGMYDANATGEILNSVDNPSAAITRMLESAQPDTFEQQVLINVQPIAAQVPGTPPPEPPSLLGQILDVAIPILLVIIGALIASAIWIFFQDRRGVSEGTVVKTETKTVTTTESTNPVPQVSSISSGEQTSTSVGDLLNAQPTVPSSPPPVTSSVQSEPEGSLVLQRQSAYRLGQTFDESYNIIDSKEAFLGQCGNSIVESMKPEPYAIEVWLFDMFTQQTMNKIFMSNVSYNDPFLRNKVEETNPRTEIIPVNGDASLTIDGKTLQLRADMQNVQVLPDGRFNSFQIKLSAWHSQGIPAPEGLFSPPASSSAQTPSAPSTSSSTSSGRSSSFGSSDPFSSRSNPFKPASSSSDGQSFSPPPPDTTPDLEDDDPFGITGDFKPTRT